MLELRYIFTQNKQQAVPFYPSALHGHGRDHVLYLSHDHHLFCFSRVMHNASLPALIVPVNKRCKHLSLLSVHWLTYFFPEMDEIYIEEMPIDLL